MCAQVEAEDSLPAVAFPYSLLSVVLVFLVLGPEGILSIWGSPVGSGKMSHLLTVLTELVRLFDGFTDV